MNTSNHVPDASNKLQELLDQIATGWYQSALNLYREHQKAMYAFIHLRICVETGLAVAAVVTADAYF